MLRVPDFKFRGTVAGSSPGLTTSGQVDCFLNSLAKLVNNQLVYLLPTGILTRSCSVSNGYRIEWSPIRSVII